MLEHDMGIVDVSVCPSVTR